MFYQAYIENGFSFPSGHAALSLALYGFLTYLAWKNFPQRYRIILVAIAALLVGLIGLSRLYLGLHFVSDVLVGYAIGTILLAGGIFVSERLSRRSVWS